MDFSQKTKEELLLEIESLQKENANLKIQENKYAFSNPFLQAIIKINSTMVKNITLEEVMSEICKILVEDGNFSMVWIGIVNDETKLVEPKAVFGDVFDYLSKIKVYADERPEGMGAIGIAIREDRPIVIQDAMHDERMKPWLDARKNTTWNSSNAVPLKISNKVVGIIAVYANEINYFTEKEIETLLTISTAFQNFADRLKIKSQLKINEIRYRRLVENLEAGIVVHAPDTSIISCNAKSSELLGLSIDQMYGKFAIDPEWKFVDEDFNPLAIENYPVNRVTRLKKPIQNQILGINRPSTKDLIWVNVNGTPIYNETGELTEVLISFFDVTDKITAEIELVAEKQKAENYLDVAEVILVAFDCNAKITLLNRKGYEVLGYNLGELEGANWFEICIPAEEQERVLKVYNKIIIGEIENLEYYENHIITKSGERRLIAWNNKLLRDSSNNITGTLSSGLDITDSRISQISLKESQERYEFVNKATQDAIYDWDIISNKVYRNESYQLLYSSNEDIGSDINWWESQVHPDDLEKLNTDLQIAFEKQEKSLTEEYRFKKQDGTYAYVIDRGHIIYNEDGKPIRMIGAMNDVTEQRNAENQLKINKNRLETIIASEPECVKIVDSRGNLLEMNPSGLAMLEAETLDDVKKKTLVGFLTPSYRQSFMDLHNKVMSGESGILEFEIIGLNGTKRWLETHATPLKDDESNEILLLGVTRDVTSRKFAEDALKSLSTTFSAISGEEFFYKVSKHLTETLGIACAFIGKLDNVKSEVIVIGGYNNGENLQDIKYEIINTPCSNVLETGICTYPQNAQKLFPKDEMLFEMGFDSYSGCPIRDKNGTTIGIMVLLDSKPLQNIEQLETVFSIYSERVSAELERMRAEEDLVISERRLSNIIEGTGVGTWEWKVQTGETVFDDRWAEMLGYTLEELAPISLETWMNLTEPEDLQKANIEIEKHFRGETDYYKCDIRMKHKNGHWVWIFDQGKVVEWDKEGKPTLMYGIHTDITERKNAEEVIKKNEIRLSNIISSTEIGTWEWDISTGVNKINDRWANMLGYTKDELDPVTFDTWAMLTEPNDLANASKLLEKHFAGESDSYNVDVRMRHKLGHWVWVLGQGKVIAWDVDGKPLLMYGTHTDITIRKEIEEKLKFTQFSIENASDAILWITKDAKIIDVNDAAVKSLGYSKEEYLTFSVHDIDPNYNAEIWPSHFEELKQKGNLVFETLQKSKDGRIIPVEVTANYIKFNDEEFNCAFVRDISERKANELRLQNQSNFINTVTNSIPSLVGYWDSDTKLTFANESYYDLFGRKPSEILGKSMKEVLGERVFSEIENKVQAALTGEEQTFERTIINKNNEIIYALVQYIPDVYENEVKGFVALTTDITEIKKTQINLNEAQRISHVGSWQWDLIKNEITWSDEQYRIYGEDKETFDVTYDNYLVRFKPEVQERIKNLIQDALDGKSDFYTESEFVKSDGTITTVVEYGKVDFSADGKPIRMFGTTQDITEVKKSNEKTQFQAALLNSVGQAVIATDEVGVITYLNRAAEALYGWSFDEAIGTNIINITVPDISMQESIEIMSKLTRGETWQGEMLVRNKNNVIFPVFINNSPIFDSKGNLKGIIGISTDITERKEKEQQLKLLESVIINANDSVLITEAEPFDEPGPRILFVNSAFTKMTGYTAEEVIGKTPRILQGTKTDKNELKKLSAALRNWEQCEATLVNYKKTGEEFWVHLSITPVANENGWFTHWIAIERDVTEKMKAEEALRQSELRYRELVKNLEVGVVLQDRDSRILLTNDKALELLGLTKEQLIGKTSFDPEWNIINENGEIFEGKDHPSNLSLTTKKPVHNVIMGVFRPLTKDRVWLVVHANPIININGEPIQTIVSFEDITERRKAEMALKESEQQLRLAIRSGDLGLWDWNARTGVLSVNDRWLEMLGLNRESITPSIEYWHSLVHPEDMPKLINIIAETINNPEGTSIEVEIRAKHSNGNYIWILDMGNIVERAEDGSPIRIVGTHMDITERKEIELAVQENEAKLRLIFDTLGEGVALNEIIYNEQGEMIDYRILEVNQAYYSVAQYDTSRKVIGALATELYKMDLQTISDFWNYHKNQKETIYTEFQGPEDGRYFGIYTSPIFNHKFVTSFLDITERRMNEKALKESEEKFRNIINLSPVPYALNDDNENVTYLNEAFINTFGYDLNDIPTLLDWWPKAYPDPIYREMVSQIWSDRLLKSKENNEPFEPMELNIHCKDGSVKTVIGEAGALSSNYLGTHLVILYDITDRKETEMELLTAKERAEESDRLKSAFLANMSHEIRTPMNGILGFTSLLKEDELNRNEQLEYIGIIEKSGSRLLNIINDIIDISKIESGQIKVNIAKTNIKEQLNYILDFFKLEAESKGIKLISKINLKDEESIIETDREKIYAALINLTKNAVKFTSKGSIEIGCNIKSNMLEFYVKDTGYGIPKDKLNLIFERFRQVSESLSRNYEGAGLGLSITKAYIEMLGGNIWAESNLGKGSTFYFTIPYTNSTKAKKANRSDMNNNDTTKSKKIKVLIAEDNEESEKFLTIAMKKYSSEILVAHNGNEAVDIAKANPDIDLILMDVQMPTLSGYEATKQIKSFNSNVIIIAQTAHGFDSDRKEALNIGCDDYISKPIDLATLNAMMKKHFNLK